MAERLKPTTRAGVAGEKGLCTRWVTECMIKNPFRELSFYEHTGVTHATCIKHSYVFFEETNHINESQRVVHS